MAARSPENRKASKVREFWAPYWNKRTDGWHRSQDEDFLQKEAREKLFHLSGGERLLDFGCGSGDLLQYLVPHYHDAVGVDFSEKMLAVARDKLERYEGKARLILGDDVTFWKEVEGESFDRIIMIGVVQYLLLSQLDSWLREADKHLAPGGKIILFDIVDSRLGPLFTMGYFNYNEPLTMMPYRYAQSLYGSVMRKISGGPWRTMNFYYSPYRIERLAESLGFDGDVVRSTYYEFRYHVILTRKGDRGSDGGDRDVEGMGAADHGPV